MRRRWPAGPNIGGFVSSYRTPEDLGQDLAYYSGMNKPSAPTAWRIFRNGNILLMISGKVQEEKALRYKKVLEGM